MHLTRFRLVEKQSATVRTHTCALSWTSPFNSCNLLVKLHGHAHEINWKYLKKRVDILPLAILTRYSIYSRVGRAAFWKVFPWLSTLAQSVLWSNKNLAHLPTIGVPCSSAALKKSSTVFTNSHRTFTNHGKEVYPFPYLFSDRKTFLPKYYKLTTPENTITYHNALCLSPQNLA